MGESEAEPESAPAPAGSGKVVQSEASKKPRKEKRQLTLSDGSSYEGEVMVTHLLDEEGDDHREEVEITGRGKRVYPNGDVFKGKVRWCVHFRSGLRSKSIATAVHVAV